MSFYNKISTTINNTEIKIITKPKYHIYLTCWGGRLRTCLSGRENIRRLQSSRGCKEVIIVSPTTVDSISYNNHDMITETQEKHENCKGESVYTIKLNKNA